MKYKYGTLMEINFITPLQYTIEIITIQLE